MNTRVLRPLVAMLLALGLLVAGCGADEEEGGAGGSGAAAETTAEPAPAEPLRIAMVTDVGGLNDRSFNQSAYEGLKQAESELGAEIRAVTSSTDADYIPNLTTLARQKYDLIIAVGFLMADATEKIANQFPEQKFSIIDYSAAAMKSKPKNVEGLLFKENEAGYLVGYMAGLYVADQGGDQVISAVGGQKVPAVDAYIAGYQKGAKDANPDVETLSAYSQSFTEQDKCKEIALDQISQGSQVVFQVAGQCGLGALDAAEQEGAQGIGVDADQSFLGDHILTSALKKIDEAVLQTAKEVQANQFGGGSDKVFDVKSDGVGYGTVNAEGEKYTKQVDEQQQKIADGELTGIPDTPTAD